VYSAQDFGLFAILSAAMVIIGTLAPGRLELAIPLPERDREGMGLTQMALLSSAVIAGLVAVVVAAAGPNIAASFGQPDLMPWMWLVPLGVLALGCFQTLNQLALREQRYRAVARRNVMQGVTTVAAQLLFSLSTLKSGGLAGGFVLGQGVGAGSLAMGARLGGRTAREALSLRLWSGLLSRYRRFPLLLGPAGLLNVSGLQLPVVLIAYWYGPEVAGWLGLTQRVLTLPVSLVGTAVAQVYLSHIARSTRTDPERSLILFRRASKALISCSMLILPVLWLGGPWLFSFVFGSQWLASGQFSQALALGLAGQLVAAPLSQTLVALERQAVQLIWDLTRVVLLVTGLALCVALGGPATAAVWVVGTVSGLMYAASWVLSRNALLQAARAHHPENVP
jgi:O-antigen/teichoic acid export membrane protein